MKKLLILVTFFNAILFSMLTPIWHGPDEQAHFGQVQNIAETGRVHKQDLNNLSQEIFISEQLLGIERDERGNNKFTHRPEYNIAYTQTVTGQDEEYIKSLPIDYRTNLVKKESTRYPPLFYYISASFYRTAYKSSLIDRVVATRFASIIMGVITVLFTLKLARLVFPKNDIAAFTAAILVSFKPMFSFLSASVNSDNLMNMLFTIFLYLCAKIIAARKISVKSLALIGLSILALNLTKPHYIIAIPTFLSVLLFIPLKIKNKPKALISFVLFAIFIRILIPHLPNPEVNLLKVLSHPRFPHVTLPEHIKWTGRHTIAEVVPWYWGVFKWLSVSLPRLTNRIINRVLIISVLGMFIWVVKLFKSRRFNLQSKLITFLFSSSFLYFLIILLWDWLFRRQHAFSFGMQGRYYFPLISAHMILLTLGLSQFLKNSWLKLLGISAIALNFVGLYTVAKSYYHLQPLKSFFLQSSQYKPLYFKYPFSLIWIITYVLLLIIFIYKYANLKTNRS